MPVAKAKRRLVSAVVDHDKAIRDSQEGHRGSIALGAESGDRIHSRNVLGMAIWYVRDRRRISNCLAC